MFYQFLNIYLLRAFWQLSDGASADLMLRFPAILGFLMGALLLGKTVGHS